MTQPYEEKLTALHEAMTNAVNDCIGTVPKERVALFLSGGLDSSIIQAIAQLDNLYCVSWPEQDNTPAALLAAMGHPLKVVTFTKEEMLDALPEIAHVTEGRGSWSQVCQWFAARKAKADGMEVVLTGECADELFGGYSRYRILRAIDTVFSDSLLQGYLGIFCKMTGITDQRHAAAKMIARKVPLETAVHLIDEHAKGVTGPHAAVESARLVDLNYGLPPLLALETAAIEAHGLRAAYPFGHEQVRNAADLFDPEERLTDAFCKTPLQHLAMTLGVTRKIVHEKTKKGLFTPQSWRPADAPLWSTGWFDTLMAECAAKAD